MQSLKKPKDDSICDTWIDPRTNTMFCPVGLHWCPRDYFSAAQWKEFSPVLYRGADGRYGVDMPERNCCEVCGDGPGNGLSPYFSTQWVMFEHMDGQKKYIDPKGCFHDALPEGATLATCRGVLKTHNCVSAPSNESMIAPPENQASPGVAEEGMTEATEQRSDEADRPVTRDADVVGEGHTEEHGSDSLRSELIQAQNELRQCQAQVDNLSMENQRLKQVLLDIRRLSAIGLDSGVEAAIPRCPGCVERGAFDVPSAAAHSLSGESTDNVVNQEP